MDLAEVIIKPIITEKATQTTSLGRYAFLVNKQATKKQITQAMKTFFGVHPQRVWTGVVRGQKKALVQLAEGEKIDLFESGE